MSWRQLRALFGLSVLIALRSVYADVRHIQWSEPSGSGNGWTYEHGRSIPGMMLGSPELSWNGMLWEPSAFMAATIGEDHWTTEGASAHFEARGEVLFTMTVSGWYSVIAHQGQAHAEAYLEFLVDGDPVAGRYDYWPPGGDTFELEMPGPLLLDLSDGRASK